MRFNDISIRARLFFGVGATALLIAALAAIAVPEFTTIRAQAASIQRESAARAHAGAVAAAVTENATATAMLLGADAAGQAPALAQLAQRSRVLLEAIRELRGRTGPAADAQTLADMERHAKAYSQAIGAAGEAADAQQHDRALALVRDEAVPHLAPLGASSAQLGRGQDQALTDVAGRVERSASATASTISIVAVLAVALCIGAGTWVIRSISRPLAAALRATRQVAAGDLAVNIDAHGGDETAQLLRALDAMAHSLRQLVGEVAEGAHTVADTSAQIARGNLDLSQRTEEQASTLEETASSMEELTSTIAQNADHARQASELAVGASQVARKGGEVVGQVVSTMNGISDSSRKIADIIGVIDGIAFQTNILALNAAVEAARAGEQGRGFAVVAAEVRNLAQRSAAAAKEIKALIGDSVDKVEAGTKLVDAAGQTMDEIVASVTKVSDLIAEIAAASREQSSGVEQVNTAVSQMEHVVQQNAALVEEATAATESMKNQAGSLLQTVARFRLAGQQPREPAAAPQVEREGAARAAAIRARPVPQLTSDFAPLAPHQPKRGGPGGAWKDL